MRTRITLGALGVLTIVYGTWRIVSTARLTRPMAVLEWLVGAVVIHDGVIAPLTVLAGFALGRITAPRARRYAAGALVASALVTAVAVPLIYRRAASRDQRRSRSRTTGCIWRCWSA